MKKLAGYGIIAGLLGVALGVFFLVGGTWEVLLGISVLFVSIVLFFGGLILAGELWGRGHRVLSVLCGVMVMGVIPGVILQWALGEWWVLFGALGAALGIFAVATGTVLLAKYAVALIKGER